MAGAGVGYPRGGEKPKRIKSIKPRVGRIKDVLG